MQQLYATHGAIAEEDKQHYNLQPYPIGDEPDQALKSDCCFRALTGSDSHG